MDPNSAIMAVLFALLGLWLGNLRSRALASDLFILGLWGILFVLNPTLTLGAAIGGYLVGWGVRYARLKGASPEDPSEDPSED